jgi:putative transcriptional regulator
MTLANLSILKTGKARAVRFSTLDAICEVLECQPGDLLEHALPTVSDGASAPAAARPQLKRPLMMAIGDEA